MNKQLTDSITVIISTLNRPEQLHDCLLAISLSTITQFHVIVIDQSTTPHPATYLREYSNLFSHFRLISSSIKNKSHGLNIAINHCDTSLIAFTDDDCLPTHSWLKTIVSTFHKHPEVNGVFGQTFPYLPKDNPQLVCPSTFTNVHNYSHKITRPCPHWLYVGYGNNMAFRKQLFDEIGSFKEWLGPGSVGSNAEDAEIILRCLINKRILFYNPHIRLFHNRWLNLKQMNQQNISYIFGESACYGFLMFKGYHFAKKVVISSLKDFLIDETIHIFKLLVHARREFFTASYWWIIKLFARLKGFAVAGYYFYRDLS